MAFRVTLLLLLARPGAAEAHFDTAYEYTAP